MKEIVINPDNISENELTNRVVTNNLLYINSNKELVLDYHHNTYYFNHSYDESDVVNLNPFLIKKKYVLDYPLFGEKTLYLNNYYLVKKDIDGEHIPLGEIISILNNTKYINPRNALVTEEMIEVIDYLLKEVI